MPDYIRKLFRFQEISFSGYIAERRLEQIYARLAGVNRPPRCCTGAIAAELGFDNQSHFNRLFRR
ncbi:helix-turn-helix domain-containing protein [Methylobacterium nodulans]|uniref:helix-turn-helix domain-containing protein n=1 Tax=Methylobacterium nodulans TaxID=114616 RepID=UPI000A071C71